MTTRRRFMGVSGLTGAGLLLPWGSVIVRNAFAQQTQLPGNQIPQWKDPVPMLQLDAASTELAAVLGNGPLAISMSEFQAWVLPKQLNKRTWVWGYRAGTPSGTPESYIGPVIVSRRAFPAADKSPTTITWTNDLGTTGDTHVLAWKDAIDQTLHWANPDGGPMTDMTHYSGPIPAVPHLHGGEVPPQIDGGPDSWFLSQSMGGYTSKGHAYWSKKGKLAVNQAIYAYPNTQEAAMIWFHDHVLGATRLNVYAGLAGAYVLYDDTLALPSGLTPAGLGHTTTHALLGDEPIVPLVLQDRMFDVNGQLFFPNLPPNPTDHPYWTPEFVGDTIVVNGKTWPTFGTAAQPKPRKRYRFLFLNGSNARTYELFFVDPVSGKMGPPMWVIGTDGGYLDAPVKIDPNSPVQTDPKKLVLMPGERYDVVVDFNDPAWLALNPGFSGTLILRNTGNTPYPKGAPPQGSTLGQILKCFIGPPTSDTGYDPRTSAHPLRPASREIVRLVSPASGTPLATPAVSRQLTLNEVLGPGGPLEVLVNNTRWDGLSDPAHFTGGVRPDFKAVGSEYSSELPNEGDVELWEIVNLTADAHPIHLHLVQFQLMNRQKFNVSKYGGAYAAAFPGGAFIPAFGPPVHYHSGASWTEKDTFGGASLTTFKGGNPDVTPWLQGPVMPPETYERGWKDTVVMRPGEVTRIMVRWAPTDEPFSATGAYPFDPNGGHGYVWHCHIIDHEDNEMMRPDQVVPRTDVTRTLVKGKDY